MPNDSQIASSVESHKQSATSDTFDTADDDNPQLDWLNQKDEKYITHERKKNSIISNHFAASTQLLKED